MVVALADLALLNWWLFKRAPSETSQTATAKSDVSASPSSVVVFSSPSPKPLASETPKPAGQSQPTPALQEQTPKTIVKTETQTIIQTPQKEIFIPLGSGSAKSGTYSDLSGVEVSIDTTKYPPIDYMVFQASIWVTNGNGKAWARIINVNDNNPFFESEISSSSASGEYRTSAKIPFVYGPKTYRVQAKTDITDYVANVSNAVIKIILK